MLVHPYRGQPAQRAAARDQHLQIPDYHINVIFYMHSLLLGGNLREERFILPYLLKGSFPHGWKGKAGGRERMNMESRRPARPGSRYKVLRATSSDPLLLAGLRLLKVPQPSHRAPSTGSQVFKYMSQGE